LATTYAGTHTSYDLGCDLGDNGESADVNAVVVTVLLMMMMTIR
jgi:hypothetical protein